MRTVWKYDVAITDWQVVVMPADAQLLAFQAQDGVPRLWALVETGNVPEQRRFVVLGTGNPDQSPGEERTYVGTVQLGEMVWHLFEEHVT